MSSQPRPSFGSLRQVDAGDLNVGYVAVGPGGGPPVSGPMTEHRSSPQALDLSHEIVDGMTNHPGIPALGPGRHRE